MAEPDLTNELVETLTQRRLTSAKQPKLDTLEKNVSKPAEPSGRPPKNLLQFVGFPYEFSVDGLVRLFTTSSFDEGVEFLKADVLAAHPLPASPQDGPGRNFVLLRENADVIYWTRRRPRANREPGGGGEYPII